MFVDAASALAAAAIPVMPLKGVLLGALAPDATADRPMLDADALVPAARAGEAVAALERAGFAVLARSASAVTLKQEGNDVSLDLHHRLFAPGLFRMDEAEVFARGTPDRALFGVDVVLPSGLDVFAHLVGHFAKGRHTRRDGRRAADFALVARACGLEPAGCARHLDRLGLRRAAAYALAEARAAHDDAFLGAVVDALGPDPLDAGLAALCRAALRARRLAPLGPYLLHPSLGAGLVAAGRHAARAVLRRTRASGTP